MSKSACGELIESVCVCVCAGVCVCVFAARASVNGSEARNSHGSFFIQLSELEIHRQRTKHQFIRNIFFNFFFFKTHCRKSNQRAAAAGPLQLLGQGLAPHFRGPQIRHCL